jgi:hypothetical protein
MSRLLTGSIFTLLFIWSIGCGSDKPAQGLVAVSGNITFNGMPVEQAKVTFFPLLETKGNGGWANTNAAGEYVIKTPQGALGVPEGQYKVTVSKRLNPDGSPPNPDEPPIESKAKEVFSPKYSDESKSTLTAKVTASSKTFDWKIDKSK